MERFLVLVFTLLFSFNVFAAVPSGVPAFSTDDVMSGGGKSLLSPANLTGSGVNGIFSLSGGDSNSAITASSYVPLYKNGTAYQVTSGKTAYCFNMTYSTGSATRAMQLVSATASFTFAQTASLTGGVYQSGQAGKFVNLSGNTTNTTVPMAGTYQFGANTFAGFQVDPGTATAHSVHMDCFEN